MHQTKGAAEGKQEEAEKRRDQPRGSQKASRKSLNALQGNAEMDAGLGGQRDLSMATLSGPLLTE
jgi:hypothetical protein